MTYFEGFIVPVPEANKDAYRKHASDFAPLVQDIGVGRMAEAWESDVPDGKVTDFKGAVKATTDEKVVYSWIEWPSKEVRDEGRKKMMEDSRMQQGKAAMPFDGQRMIYGGFATVLAA